MRIRVRVAGTVVACAASAFLIGAAASAPAAGPPIVDYRAIGSARGLDVAFAFQSSIFERLVDLGVPGARSDLNSEAGGASSGSAAQLFPGDVLVGALGEAIPGYRQAVYPATAADPKPVDEAYLTDTFMIPPMQAGPVSLEVGKLRATASANESSGFVTTGRLAIGMDAPFIEIRTLEAFSGGTRAVDHVTHVARTTVGGLTINVSEALKITIGSIVSVAQTSSDGDSPTADTTFTIKDVTVTMNDQTLQAAIDSSGIRLVGPLPSQVPSFVPQDLNQTLALLLKQAGVSIATAGGVKRIEEVTSDASIGGLVITLSGTVPNVFIPQAVAEIQAEVINQLPKNVQDLFTRSICYVEDIKPNLPKEFTDAFPDLPICVSDRIVPGPGSGVITSFAIGSVRSSSVAIREFALEEPPIDIPSDGGFIPPLGPIDAGPIGGGGFIPGGNGGAGTPAGRPAPLFGLVAKMPAGALLGGGTAFLALAIGVALGPSLRAWRRVT